MSDQPWYSYPMTQGYNAHGHTGVDVGTPTGTPLTPLFAGTVEDAARYPWGSQVVVRSNVAGVGDVRTVYAHMDRVDVHPGQQVGTATRIGVSGGENLPRQYSNGPHTHVGMYRADVPVWQNLRSNGSVATVDPTGFVSAAPLANLQGSSTLMGSTSGTSGTSGAGNCGHYITLPAIPGQQPATICFDAGLDVLVRFGLISTGVLIIVLAIIIFVRQTPAAKEATGRAVAGFRAAFPAINVATTASAAAKPAAPAAPKARRAASSSKVPRAPRNGRVGS